MKIRNLNCSYKFFHKQQGFFDFGIGLGLLALFGGTAVVITNDADKEIVVVEAQMESMPVEILTETEIVKASQGD